MKIIRIESTQNKQVEYLYNKAMGVMKENRCGGRFELGTGGGIEINPWCAEVANKIKETLEKLKISFQEK